MFYAICYMPLVCYIRYTLVGKHICYTVVAQLLHLNICHTCYKIVTQLSNCVTQFVEKLTKLLQICYTIVTQLLHSCYLVGLTFISWCFFHNLLHVVTQLLHSCYTVGTQLLHSCYTPCWSTCYTLLHHHDTPRHS